MTAIRPFILYGGGVSQSASIEALLCELGLAYELRRVDLAGSGQAWRELQAINPAGLAPALVLPDGTVMHETAAILLYLCDVRADAGFAPLPHAPRRAEFLTRFIYLNNEIAGRTKTFFYPHRWSASADDAGRIRNAAFDSVIERWRLVEAWLSDPGPFVVGQHVTIADLVIANWAAYGLREAGDIVERYPAVRTCCDAVRAREKSAKIFAELDAALASWRESQ